MPYVASRSPATFSNERGPGAFAPLVSLPKASKNKKSLFHIPSDDDQDQQEPSPPPTPPLRISPSPSFQRVTPPSVPFPTTSPATPTSARSTSPPIQRTSSSSSVVLANGRPLKPSLKSASSSSIADDMAAPGARHARAQSMPSTPAFGPKNVHFKEKEDGLESVRLFRRTGKPASVSKTTSDTETETEPEHLAYPFPHVSKNTFASLSSSALSEIADCSTIPARSPSPYANVHLESVTLPPARPPVLRGTIIVRNIAFEKSVGVRFTLDEWTTVSEVLATYSGPVGALETLVGTTQGKTVGDLIGSLPEPGWDRFNFAIKLEDYETYLWQRTLFLVVRYSAPAGEWWDNNSGDNYRVTFRAHSTPAQPERKRGATAPSTAPFLLSVCPPLTSRVTVHEEPRPTFSPPQRPPIIPRSVSSPVPVAFNPGLRLNLRHYAAPAPPPRIQVSPPNTSRAPSSADTSRVGSDGQSATLTPPETPTLQKKELISDKDEVDEGFATGSEDGDDAETHPDSRPQLSLKISSPSPVTMFPATPVSLTQSPPPRQHGPFSPTREPFSPRSAGGAGDSYATLIREWCFAQGPDTFGAGATIGAQSAVPWVGGMN